MSSVLAKRIDLLMTESAFEVLAKARKLEAQGRSVIHLEIGEPDFDTPQHIKDAAVRALADGYTHYPPTAGLPQVRQAVAEYVARSRAIPVAAEEVIITPGAKPILFFLPLACLESGDEAIYPDPGFPTYQSMIRFTGARPVPITLHEELDFRLDVDELRRLITPKTKMIILNSPHNPTGGVLSQEDLEGIAEAVRGRNLVVLADEIYSRILYDRKHHSLASLPGMKEQVVILDGFSKTYAMTGWRLGYGVMRADLADAVRKLMVNSVSCTAAFSQMATIQALQGPQEEAEAMVAEFRCRRDLLVAGLNRIPGVSCRLPVGAFYAFPNVKSFGRSSGEIANLLLEQGGVATLAGRSFGEQGEGYLRLSYANSTPNLEEALVRIERTLALLT
ncbi:MAG: pyridoxal phosphate-dependent aminotransferase [Coprothermobacterota bacterium]|jgi:aspartate/methionine/tyrosine aminotransferase|nr:pyridoxal phosphate-dependent aminotransferase [Coprothermobacterota bacterium]